MYARLHLIMTVALAAALCLVSVTVASAISGTTPELEDAMRFRESLSLRADRDYVEDAAIDTRAFPDTSWGVPLSVEEAAEVDRRHALQSALAPAESYAQAQEGFAGIYMDQRSGGVPVFQFAGTAERHRDPLADLLPVGTAFRLEIVPSSWEQLDSVQEALDQGVENLAAEGISITRTAIVPSLNSIVVGVRDLEAGDAAYLKERYGPPIVVQEESAAVADACTGFADCWPPKGGIRITQGSAYCTSGFLARRHDVNRVVVVTAGHCIATNGGEGAIWKHDGRTIGPGKQWVWTAYANSDVGLVNIYDSVSSTMTSFNRYLAKASPVEVLSLTYVLPATSQHEGYLVCRVGATSGRNCGTIVGDDVSMLSCVGSRCYLILHLKEVDFDSTSGDSGGSVFSKVTDGVGYGLHVHSEVDTNPPPRHGWYTPLTRARSTMSSVHGIDISFCITSSC